MPHDHASHSHAPTPPQPAADVVSAFAVAASTRLGLAAVAAVLLWLAVAWALEWL